MPAAGPPRPAVPRPPATERGRVRRGWAAAAVVTGGLLLGACGGDAATGTAGASATSTAAATAAPTAAATTGAAADPTDVQRYPDVIDAELERSGDAWDVAVTISSPYDTAERYADGWRVLDGQGNVLGTHQLAHDHAGEQPFTRTQRGLQIPESVEAVTIEGRDLEYGFGGETVTVEVPR